MKTIIFFFVYGIGSGFFFGMDIALFILSLMYTLNPSLAFAAQIGQSLCLMVLLVGGSFGMMIGPLIMSFMVEIVHFASPPVQWAIFGGVITAFGTPIMIQSVPLMNWIVSLLGRQTVCHHVNICQCASVNGSTNRFIQDVHESNMESMFWNPVVIIQMSLPGNFLGLILGYIFAK